MVRVVQRDRSRHGAKRLFAWLLSFAVMGITFVLWMGRTSAVKSAVKEELKLLTSDVGGVAIPERQQQEIATASVKEQSPKAGAAAVCPYTKLQDLTAGERYPTAGPDRHMVTPPADTSDLGVTLVCCQTTAGPWSILVHHSWAPIGARRFLDMVESNYFESTVPLFRCVQNFLCQFGLNGMPKVMKPFRKSLPDDPNWLPEGKDHRQNKLGVKRFQKGYMAYAGAGPTSRTNQFIVALTDNGPLAGGSPWEVPWGELVGAHSYETLSKVYTGYGEKGPKQGLLWKANALDVVHKDFPKMDYVLSCRVVDQEGGQGVKGSTMTKK